MKKALIKISGREDRPNSIIIIFSQKAVELIDSKEIILIKSEDTMKIKRPTLESKKTYSLKTNVISFSCNEANALVGEYYIDDSNIDEMILTKIN